MHVNPCPFIQAPSDSPSQSDRHVVMPFVFFLAVSGSTRRAPYDPQFPIPFQSGKGGPGLDNPPCGGRLFLSPLGYDPDLIAADCDSSPSPPAIPQAYILGHTVSQTLIINTSNPAGIPPRDHQRPQGPFCHPRPFRFRNTRNPIHPACTFPNIHLFNTHPSPPCLSDDHR